MLCLLEETEASGETLQIFVQLGELICNFVMVRSSVTQTVCLVNNCFFGADVNAIYVDPATCSQESTP